MKYDTNDNPVELAGSKIDYDFKKNDLEVAGNVSEPKINDQEDYDSESSSANGGGTTVSQLLWITLTIILVIGMMSIITKTVENISSHTTVQDIF